MDITSPRMPPRISPPLRLLLAVGFVFLMFNLSAVMNALSHREIPYLGLEHVAIGGVTALVTAVLLALLELYIRRLERALDEVKSLEGLLPICAWCKKIRTPDNQWHIIETYINERTDATFTHGICPECTQQRHAQRRERP